MVIHHVKKAVGEMRERPPHEREAIATLTAVGVVAVLLVGWLIFFVRGVMREPATSAQQLPVVQQATGTAVSAKQSVGAQANTDATTSIATPTAAELIERIANGQQ